MFSTTEKDTKVRVLEVLEQHRGESVSGESLAKALGLSRNAIWKSIRELRSEGYHIPASTRRGYCLTDENDLLSAAGIVSWLSPSARCFADRIRVFPTLASTNRTAKEMALAGAEHGTVILAGSQTAGRGRFSRNFFSPPGSLYMSLILRAEALPFRQVSFVTAFAGVAVCEAIGKITGKTPGIKWVNDLLMDGKKICGILSEAVTDMESGRLDWIVVGIGVNVHTRTDDFPPELRDIAASVDPDRKIPGILNRLAAEIINRIIGCGESVSQEEILKQYKDRLVILGRKITVLQGNDAWEATALDLNEEGHLLVRNEKGELLSLSSGEIRIRL